MTNATSVPNKHGSSRFAVKIITANKTAETRSVERILATAIAFWYSDYFPVPVILE
jgi:hypothetical protein